MSYINSKEYINKRLFLKDQNKSAGRIGAFIYYGKTCIGVSVKRPDLLLMFHRKQVFLPLEIVKFENKSFTIDSKKSFIKNPYKIEEQQKFIWDKTAVWEGSQVCIGNSLIGYVDNVVFDNSNGKIKYIELSEGKVSGLILGKTQINSKDIKGYVLNKGIIALNDSVELIESDAGLAEKAGHTSSVIIHKIKKKAPKVGKDAKNFGKKAVDEMQVQSDKIHKTFKDFADEFKKGLND